MKTTLLKAASLLYFFSCLITSTVLLAQTGVGINTTTPTEELDVNGDIAVSGAIVPNGVAGTQGQVLQMQAGGTMAWADLSKYQNMVWFNTASSAYWSIPTGVTEVMAQMWAGGGASSKAGGGGGGSYVLCKINVTGVTQLSITVGSGADPSATPPTSATDSRIVIPSTATAYCYAGLSASANAIGAGGSGGYSSNVSLIQLFAIEGGDGKKTTMEFSQADATTYYTVYNYGDGGSSPLRPLTGGRGGYVVKNSGGYYTAATVFNLPGNVPGGGGGSYESTTGNSGGADGSIILYW